jgi:hypothetical protein
LTHFISKYFVKKRGSLLPRGKLLSLITRPNFPFLNIHIAFILNYYFRALVDSSVGGPHISKIVTSLTSGLSSLYDPQRITVAAFFSEVNT